HHSDLRSFPTRRSSDLRHDALRKELGLAGVALRATFVDAERIEHEDVGGVLLGFVVPGDDQVFGAFERRGLAIDPLLTREELARSEEHTSELQSPCNLV